jgi:hypothetical protein
LWLEIPDHGFSNGSWQGGLPIGEKLCVSIRRIANGDTLSHQATREGIQRVALACASPAKPKRNEKQKIPVLAFSPCNYTLPVPDGLGAQSIVRPRLNSQDESHG